MIRHKILLIFWVFLSLPSASDARSLRAENRCLQAIKAAVPQLLSETCLYKNIKRKKISQALHLFTPNYQLWSDGANKTRWIFLPPGKQITTDDPDQWHFPVGTQFFKEFRQQAAQSDGANIEIKVETRHLMKVRPGSGLDAWEISTYQWLVGQSDAVRSDGAKNVLGTRHIIPSREDCITCHKGNLDFILGFDAIQLSDAQAKNAFGHGPARTKGQWSLQTLIDKELLTLNMDQPTLPGTELEQKVLGYLHSNCGNCHNPNGHAAEQEAEHLVFRHKLSFRSPEGTDVYDTAVNQPTQNFTSVPYIVMGAQHEELALYESALFLRMNSLDENYRMPMVASQQIDYAALELIHQWLLTLPTPADYKFQRDESQLMEQGLGSFSKAIIPDLPDTPGLHLQFVFSSPEAVPDVMIAYWPEDSGLVNQPVMDHKNGHFTKKLIVGNQGDTMSLLNSDDVGHTIYVKDKRQDVRWQLNYMPPGSSFEQELFWRKDTFVELRCRLHLYMSAWAGSISSRYYKIVNFNLGRAVNTSTMSGIPNEFTELKIWMPRKALVETRIGNGQTLEIDLGSGSKVILKRVKEI